MNFGMPRRSIIRASSKFKELITWQAKIKHLDFPKCLIYSLFGKVFPLTTLQTGICTYECILFLIHKRASKYDASLFIIYLVHTVFIISTSSPLPINWTIS